MLSICIPVYEFDVRALVKGLHQQASSANIQFEILLIDDASAPKWHLQYHELRELSCLTIEILAKNTGRSAIRNRLFQRAKFDFILIMDCDLQLENSNYVHEYWRNRLKNGIVIGGLSYAPTPPQNSDFLLRWKYGKNREVSSQQQRSQRPYQSFMTNNFLIHKSVFEQLQFNENLKGYGHEDTLFGIELELARIPIRHINNPIRHIGLEPATLFLNKTKHGVQNLLLLFETENQAILLQQIKLLRYFNWLKKSRLSFLFLSIYGFFSTKIKQQLSGKNPSLFFFDLFKLGEILAFDNNRK